MNQFKIVLVLFNNKGKQQSKFRMNCKRIITIFEQLGMQIILVNRKLFKSFFFFLRMALSDHISDGMKI